MDTMLRPQVLTPNPILVKLVGRDASTGAVEFEGILSTAFGQNTFLPPRVIEPNRLLLLLFSIDWGVGESTRATARVRGFEEATVTLDPTGMVVAQITHAQMDDEECELMCLDSGIKSNGPCLNCSNGVHTIRVCC